MRPHRVIVSFLALAASFAAARVADAQAGFPGAQWPTASPSSVGFDTAKLNAALSGLKGNVAVVRQGYLVATKGDVAQKQTLFSVSKSITSLLFGVAMQKGKVAYDQTVPNSNYPSSPLATWRHFLSMTSDYGLSPHAPGAHYAYNNKAVDFYGKALEPHLGPGTPLMIAQKHLWSVVGNQDAQGFKGQWGGWGGGFEGSARDIARLGYLLLRNGNWNGQQVVPASFVAALYANQIPSNATASTSKGTGTTEGVPGDNWWNQQQITNQLKGGYSFGWWNNADKRHAGIPQQALFAKGLHGHFIVVVPSADLVIGATYLGQDVDVGDFVPKILAALDAGTPPPPPPTPVTITGELREWHAVTLTFQGPSTSESASPNPFRDYRLDVTFTRNGKSYVVPGYYAADGNAHETSASSGNAWRVHFMPDAPGAWTWTASFRTGTDVAIASSPTAGTPTGFHGVSGSLNVAPTNKGGADFRGKGLLQYVGGRYPRFAGTGESFVKGGAGSPENLLAYAGFDQTPASHHYQPHAVDWAPGHPDWKGGKGRNIIGALNYLAAKGMNSVYFLVMNVNGDGKDVWPWTSASERYRFDCSKLDQWNVVFSHMTARGLHLHLFTQEMENDDLLDGGALGVQRKLYYRELVARFAHHPALTWNLGEENGNTDAQRKEFANWLRALDPYDHPIAVHTYPGQQNQVYQPLLGFANFENATLQVANPDDVHAEVTKWVGASQSAGKPWLVTLDEVGPANLGVVPDSDDPQHDAMRHKVLWGTLMAGGAGVEWYFGYGKPNDDLDCEDWRSRDNMWSQTRVALDFFANHLPFTSMVGADHLTPAADDYVLAQPGGTYALYLPENAANAQLDFGGAVGPYEVRWFDPRQGSPLLTGTVPTVAGPGLRALGAPPYEAHRDWVALVRPITSFSVAYGFGHAGSGGIVPKIACNEPAIGNPAFRLLVTGAKPNALSLLAMGTHPTTQPLASAYLWNVANVGMFPRTTNGSGAAALDIAIPWNAGFFGKSLYHQWIVIDPGAAGGIATTNGLWTVFH